MVTGMTFFVNIFRYIFCIQATFGNRDEKILKKIQKCLVFRQHLVIGMKNSE